jgi:hypothetical protein
MFKVMGIPAAARLGGGFGNGARSIPAAKHFDTSVTGWTSISLSLASAETGQAQV